MSDGNGSRRQRSVFDEKGLEQYARDLLAEIQEVYLGDRIPWVIGYSGGKDSSAVLQLVWLAIAKLPEEQRTKPIHIISTDTLVEQPVVAAWVDASHGKMRMAAREQKLPFTPHKLVPDVKDTFWVNLIGKGYPKPTTQFRWCTSRMKINPSNNFIRNVVRDNGEALLILGTRKAESQRRAQNMEKHERHRVRERISPNAALPNSLIYTPIEDWSNDDVWQFLMAVPNPWGHTNKSLLGMYQGASADNECPLVVDTSTPSCGSSRFGCWVCTVVDEDRSMTAMIKNDDEKLWMTPLLELRNELAEPNDRSRRDFRRIDGRVQLFNGKTIPGPYKREWREHWIRRVLDVQQNIREHGPEEVREIELISIAEMHEIRRIWKHEKGEFSDRVPTIYAEVMREEFPALDEDDTFLDQVDWDRLSDLCDGDEVFFQLQAELLDIERKYRGMARRAGIFKAIEAKLRAAQFSNEDEAYQVREADQQRREEIRKQVREDIEPRTQQSLFDESEEQIVPQQG